MIKLVIIESPYAGDVEANLAYARKACLHSIKLGETPFASHLFYTQFLNDKIHTERRLGIQAGFNWGHAARLLHDTRIYNREIDANFLAPSVVFYVDRGWSLGMETALEHYTELGMPCVVRRIGDSS